MASACISLNGSEADEYYILLVFSGFVLRINLDGKNMRAF